MPRSRPTVEAVCRGGLTTMTAGAVSFETGIHKRPVERPVAVGRAGIRGDRSAAPEHGGPYKAVCVYPLEHYPEITRELGLEGLGAGAFGENLSTRGLDEDGVAIGDRLEIGSALFVVTQPRLPCSRLAGRWRSARLIETIASTLRTGFYLRVERPGRLAAGDAIGLTPAAGDRVSVRQAAALYLGQPAAEGVLERAAGLEELSPEWRARFERQVERGGPGRVPGRRAAR